MKKFIVAGVASLTLLSAFPMLAKNASDKDNNRGGSDRSFEVRMNADVHVTVDAACMKDAAKNRGTALVNAYNAYNTAITNALKVRTDAQVSAWAMVDVDQRAVALKASEKTFTSSYNTASWTLERTKHDIRKQYGTAEKKCVTRNNSSTSSSSVSSSSQPNSSSSHSSSSVACTDVSGKLKGGFSVSNLIGDTGRTYSLAGTGEVSTVGAVETTGKIQGLGFIATGRATGDITLTQGDSKLVLHVEGPVQTGFATLPNKFSYTVQSATGVFASYANKSGELGLNLKGTTNGTFTLEFKAKCDR